MATIMSCCASTFPVMMISCSAESRSSSPPRIGLPKSSTSTNYSASASASASVHHKISSTVDILPRTIKETSVKLLDDFVDGVFEFVDQPYLPSQSNFAPVDEIGEPVHATLIHGSIPHDFPEGVYIRNGANPLHGAPKSAVSVFGKSSHIWVEGEGMIHALYFNKDHSSTDGSSWTTFYNNKYVTTDTFQLEKQRKKPVFLPATEGDPPAVLSAFLLNLTLEILGIGMRLQNPGIVHSLVTLRLIRYEKDKYARIGVMPRYGDVDSMLWFEVKPCCAFHIINCYEEDDEVVVMACIAKDSIIPGPDLGKDKFGWFSRGFKKGINQNGEGAEEYRKIEYHMLPENTFCTGASFVAKQGAADEDDGWLITFVHNEDNNVSEVYIVDAKKISSEAVAKIRLPCRVPYGFHGAYMPAS
ncbi:UNVERIFIED_CONTAM: Carotenoid 9,10(9',10')-cleavage dioxygenase [Sesamum calycinum]|uniref:Carotenoid 9,10(9',10')-cleavage dioxygenase n=1 Tax=Sesamum calycinum TaxID=2727403 RepID=A0AAW2LWV6_9LAMI